MSSLFDLSDKPIDELPGYQRTFAPGRLTVGLSLPIEQDAEAEPKDAPVSYTHLTLPTTPYV